MQITVNVACYDVSGDSVSDVRASMNDARVRALGSDDGTDAVTRWKVKIDWTYDHQSGRCQAASLAPSIVVDYIYPSLVTGSRQAASLVTRWNGYIASLQSHERGHQQNGLSALEEAVSHIEGLNAPTCPEFEQLADERIAEEIGRANTEDLAYDAATDHGRTQGARFP